MKKEKHFQTYRAAAPFPAQLDKPARPLPHRLPPVAAGVRRRPTRGCGDPHGRALPLEPVRTRSALIPIPLRFASARLASANRSGSSVAVPSPPSSCSSTSPPLPDSSCPPLRPPLVVAVAPALTVVSAKVRPYWVFPPPLPAMAAVGRRAWPELLRPPIPPRFAFDCPP
jgi:hypothetical protein